jgi:mono/diheme cytochrome c family protein
MNSDSTKVTLKALKAGSTMVHAAAGGQTVSAPLTIAMYTAEENATGKARYTTAPDKDNPPCQECHGAGKGPDHTPSEVDADPDEDITNTFLTGKDPEGRPVGEEFKAMLKGKTHMWKVTKAEETGLVAYLRSLTPTGYPEYDADTAGE